MTVWFYYLVLFKNKQINDLQGLATPLLRTNMISEIKEFTSNTLPKRLSSPFVSTLLFSLALTNYDILLVYFSSEVWDVKLTFIEANTSNMLNPFSSEFQWHRFYLPVTLALFYVLIWPACDLILFHVTKTWNHKYKEKQLKAEQETAVSQEEVDEIVSHWRNKLVRAQNDLSQSEKRSTNIEKRLQDENKNLKNTIKENETAIDQLSNGNLEAENTLLKLKGEHIKLKETLEDTKVELEALQKKRSSIESSISELLKTGESILKSNLSGASTLFNLALRIKPERYETSIYIAAHYKSTGNYELALTTVDSYLEYITQMPTAKRVENKLQITNQCIKLRKIKLECEVALNIKTDSITEDLTFIFQHSLDNNMQAKQSWAEILKNPKLTEYVAITKERMGNY